MSLQQVPGLYYAPSAIHGRGVFCSVELQPDDIIEIAPVLVLEPEEMRWISQSRLYDYYFQWGEKHDWCALGWGYASLYNHSHNPNADFIPDYDRRLITFVARTVITAGQEITINYHAGLKGR